MSIDEDIVKLLGQLGFMAGGRRMVAEADAITKALELLRPDSERPLIIRAFAQLNANNATEAVRILQDQALKINPQSTLAKGFLGLALHKAGRMGERDKVLNEVIEAGDDEDAVSFAQGLLLHK